ncbi:hypothetical protein [Actinacidiphila paucisporea]|uniref:hypothetical protein n=1 Tax=Actinacidiphila paucisporea TaxID=310782 RepID=UPI001356405A|nr:hypothetical protein [Actinacidiphila paucisporea]
MRPRESQPDQSSRVGKPSPADQVTAAALCDQLAFGDDADDVQEDQDDDQAQKFVIGPE